MQTLYFRSKNGQQNLSYATKDFEKLDSNGKNLICRLKKPNFGPKQED